MRYQGNWIPHRLRAATAGGVFFAGDSAGHCLPLTAEGIRTAFHFGLALGRELRAVVEGRATREAALAAYAAFSAAHARRYDWMLRRPAARPARSPATARRGDPRDGHAALRRLVVRPLPSHRAAADRKRGAHGRLAGSGTA